MTHPSHPGLTTSNKSRTGSLIAAAVTIGFAAVVAMWVVWFLTNLPAVATHVPHSVSGPLILLVAAAVLLAGCTRLPRNDRLVAGVLAGGIAGLVDLLALGSQLTAPTKEGSAAPGTSGLVPNAVLIAVCFIAVMCITGLVAGFGARSMGGQRSARSPREWYASFAMVNAWAILPLLALGGLVTSAKAGFAVPDWPGTYGANMLLYPIALMTEPRIFLEHSHRLFGMMVGLTTVAGFVFSLVSGSSGRVKLTAAGLLALVILQGIAGGVWTQDKAKWMVIAHGVTGQVFFALACAHAASVSGSWLSFRSSDAANTVLRPRAGILVLLGLLFVQLVMGTMARHLGSKGTHAVYTHAALAMVILILGIIVATKMMKLKPTPQHGKSLWLAGHNVLMAIGLQFLLGWVALIVWYSTKDAVAPVSSELATAEAIKPWEVIARTAHQANGALVMGSSAVMAVWGLARRKA
ncbi:MAG: COX15/CtaA family protein [Phycisphaerales bacterium]